MKKLFFLLIIISTFSSCITLAPRPHRYTHYFHYRPIITKRYFEHRYEAPSRSYRKRGF